jgi:hypothetical protein
MNKNPTLLFVAICLVVGFGSAAFSHVSRAQTSEIRKRSSSSYASTAEDMPFKPTVDTYTVQQGDNLWNISRRVVGSAWLWPKVWSYNPEITNPNWIYPGDQIRFYPSDVELPSLYDLASGERPIAEAEPTEKVEMIDQKPVGYDSSRYVGLFITPKELAEAGTLRNSTDEHILLSRNDRVFLSFPKESQPRSGERYLVYRTVGKVRHPLTNKDFGYMTEVTGYASIEEVYEKVSKAKLYHTRLEVERGQFVTKLDNDPREKVTPVVAANAIEGYVLAVNYDTGVIAGRNDVAFIDKGKNDGVQRGNQFTVERTDDPIVADVHDLPGKAIATLIVVEAKENASTCLVMRSKMEVAPGQKVRAVTRQ